ncbi:shikimate kinase [Xylophilus sp. Leaf220]|uniref:shikimate kinase n=1 Tax=Xylophilus sp. Leaf220 TaxID=1735686 RepID=UPI0006FF83ED|nr:shikimate kinase [Xylophilus sp. Leaf220]KQM71412.1 shikimate kinase [Xylophilus sp. Leaf220]
MGLPGSGKSTIGRQLAHHLGLQFLDTDHVIEQRLGCSVLSYFEQEGEAAFRLLESEVLRELCGRTAVVLATGGGAVLRAENRQSLRRAGRVIYLHSAPENLFRRLRHDRTRPLLQVDDPMQRLKSLYHDRDPLYREIAHEIIETGRLPASVLVQSLVGPGRPHA